MVKRLTAAIVALALGVALSLVGATAAQAHTGDLEATSVCHADGSSTVTYTLTTSAVPNDKNGHPLVGTTVWKIGGQSFASTPTSATGLNLGPVSSTGNQTIVLGSYTTPVGATQANWAYAWTTWPDGATKGSDGGDIDLSGCLVPDAAAGLTVTQASCTSATTVSWTGLVNATGGTLSTTVGPHNGVATAKSGHKFSAGTGVSADGKTLTIPYTIAAQLSGDSCLATATLTPATSCTTNSTQTPTVSHATLTSGALKTTPGNYSATFTADSGYHFSNNTSTLVINYSIVGPLGYQNTNANAPCYKTVDVTPTFPSQTGPTCTTAGSLPSLPTNQTGITFTWAPDGLTMIATAKTGYSFAAGATTTHLYSTPGGPTGYQNTNPQAPCYQEVSVIPTFPTQTGPTCTTAGSALPSLPTNETGITFTWAADGLTMVATANAGFFFPGGTTTTHLYSTPAGALGYQNTNPNGPCYQAVPVTPTFPTQTGPTCTTAGSALPSLPTGQTGITFTWDADGLTMIATPTSGYYFPVGTVATHLYSTPASAIGYQNTDANAPCYKTVDVTPTFPSQTGPTCTTAGSLPGLPTDQTGITFTWDADGLTMIATANPGYTFPVNTVTTHLYTTPGGATGYQNTDAAAPCYQAVPVAPMFPDATGPTCSVAGALPALPTGTNVTYTWDVDGLTMIATANPGYTFPVNTVTTHLYTAPAPATGYQNTNPDAKCYQLVSVAPTASSTNQVCSAITNHLENGSITVGINTGVDYEITNDADATHSLIPYGPLSGQTVALSPGSYTVHPVAEAGYELSPPTDIPLTIEPYTDACGQLITHPLVDPSSVQVQIGCKTSGSYTLSSDQVDPTSVVWTVNGSVVAQNTYAVAAAGHYVIDAAPGPGFGFAFGTTTHWVYDFALPTTCDLTTLALTGSTPDGVLVLAGFLVLFGLVLTRRAALVRKTARN